MEHQDQPSSSAEAVHRALAALDEALERDGEAGHEIFAEREVFIDGEVLPARELLGDREITAASEAHQREIARVRDQLARLLSEIDLEEPSPASPERSGLLWRILQSIVPPPPEAPPPERPEVFMDDLERILAR